MGFFDDAKLAADLMKNINPSEMKELMARVKDGQKALEGSVKKIIDEEIKKRGLVSREEVMKIINDFAGR